MKSLVVFINNAYISFPDLKADFKLSIEVVEYSSDVFVPFK